MCFICEECAKCILRIIKRCFTICLKKIFRCIKKRVYKVPSVHPIVFVKKTVDTGQDNLERVLNKIIEIKKGTSTHNITGIIDVAKKGDLLNLFQSKRKSIQKNGLEVEELKQRYSLTQNQFSELKDYLLKNGFLLPKSSSTEKSKLDMTKLDNGNVDKLLQEFNRIKEIDKLTQTIEDKNILNDDMRKNFEQMMNDYKNEKISITGLLKTDKKLNKNELLKLIKEYKSVKKMKKFKEWIDKTKHKLMRGENRMYFENSRPNKVNKMEKFKEWIQKTKHKLLRGSGSSTPPPQHNQKSEKAKGAAIARKKSASKSKVHVVTRAEVHRNEVNKRKLRESRSPKRSNHNRKSAHDRTSRSPSRKRNASRHNVPTNELRDIKPKKNSPLPDPDTNRSKNSLNTPLSAKIRRVFGNRESPSAVIDDKEIPISKKDNNKNKNPNSNESIPNKKNRKEKTAPIPPSGTGKPVTAKQVPAKKDSKGAKTTIVNKVLIGGKSDEKQKVPKITDDKIKKSDNKSDHKSDKKRNQRNDKDNTPPSSESSDSTHQNIFKTLLKKQVWRMSKPYIRRNKRLSSLLEANKIDLDKIKIDKVDLSLIDIDQLGIENQTIKKSVIWLLK